MKKWISNLFDLDGVGTTLRTEAIAGATLGTSTTTSYIESSAGIAEGGRTGITAIVVGILFLATGRFKDVGWLMYILGALFITKFIFLKT